MLWTGASSVFDGKTRYRHDCSCGHTAWLTEIFPKVFEPADSDEPESIEDQDRLTLADLSDEDLLDVPMPRGLE